MSAFLKNLPIKVLGAGVYLSEAPDPPSSCYTLYEYIYPYSHREGGGEGGFMNQ